MIDLEKHNESQEQQEVQQEEQQEAPQIDYSSIKPDLPSVGWVLLTVFLLGPLGIIPAIVFFSQQRPKRALCCLVPALIYLVSGIILSVAAMGYAKNNPVIENAAESSITYEVTSAPNEDDSAALTGGYSADASAEQEYATYESAEQDDITDDILGCDIPIVSGTDYYQIYQATHRYFDNIRNCKINCTYVTESDLSSTNLTEDAISLITQQYLLAEQLQEFYALADDDSDHRILYREMLGHLDTVRAVIKSIEIDPDDPVVCPPLLDNAAYVTLDIYYMDYLPVYEAVVQALNSLEGDDDGMMELVSNAYERYKDQIPLEELEEDENHGIFKSAMYAYLYDQYLYCAEPKVETDVLATLWHRNGSWEMELVGLPLDTGMNICTAGLFIDPQR